MNASSLEYAVYPKNAQDRAKAYSRMPEAARAALALATTTGVEVVLDVLTWSRSAAILYAGEEGGAMYDEDPEASVFDRIIITASSLGRIP